MKSMISICGILRSPKSCLQVISQANSTGKVLIQLSKESYEYFMEVINSGVYYGD